MSKHWAAACHRGELSLTVMTPKVAAESGIAFRKGAKLCGLVVPDDGLEPFKVLFMDATAVARFCEEMAPHTLRVLCDSLEDGEPLRAALEEMRLNGASSAQ